MVGKSMTKRELFIFNAMANIYSNESFYDRIEDYNKLYDYRESININENKQHHSKKKDKWDK